ncbi:MAG: hypothetical protein QG673_236 [Pseudomonadota bacterium]|nr:hypothetical protein [Pseudomonadota bacterium]
MFEKTLVACIVAYVIIISVSSAYYDNKKLITAIENGCEYRETQDETTITNCKLRNPNEYVR